MGNAGHRLGENDDTAFENTIRRMRDNIRYQGDKDFKYWEFDLNELGDRTVVVYHDRDFMKYDDQKKLRNVDIKFVKNKYPYIPTLKELLTEFKNNSIIKPIRIEIKRVVSDNGRQQLIDFAAELRKTVHPDVQFIAFRSHWKKSFPKKIRKKWGNKFHSRDFKILNVKNKKKDLFGKQSWWDKLLNWL